MDGVFTGEKVVSLASLSRGISLLDEEISRCESEIERELHDSLSYCVKSIESTVRGKEVAIEILESCLFLISEEDAIDDLNRLHSSRQQLQENLDSKVLYVEDLKILDSVLEDVLQLKRLLLLLDETGNYVEALEKTAEITAKLQEPAVADLLNPLPLLSSIKNFLRTSFGQIRDALSANLQASILLIADKSLERRVLIKAKLTSENTLSKMLKASRAHKDWRLSVLKPALEPLFSSIVIPFIKNRTLDLQVDARSACGEYDFSLYRLVDKRPLSLTGQLDRLALAFSTLQKLVALEGAPLDDLFSDLGQWYYGAIAGQIILHTIDPILGLECTPDAITALLKTGKTWEDKWAQQFRHDPILGPYISRAPERQQQLKRTSFLASVQTKCVEHVALYGSSPPDSLEVYLREHAVSPDPLAATKREYEIMVESMVKTFALTRERANFTGLGVENVHRIGPTQLAYSYVTKTAHELWYQFVEDSVVDGLIQSNPVEGLHFLRLLIHMYLNTIPGSRQKVIAQLFSERGVTSQLSDVTDTDPINSIFSSGGTKLKALYGSVASIVRPLSSSLSPMTPLEFGSPLRLGLKEGSYKHILPFVPKPGYATESLPVQDELDGVYQFETALASQMESLALYSVNYLVLLHCDAYWLADKLTLFQASNLGKILSVEDETLKFSVWELILTLRGRALNIACAIQRLCANGAQEQTGHSR